MQRPSRVYQILALLLYGDFPWLARFDNGDTEVKTTPLAKLLKCRNEQIRECFRWLKQHNFIGNLELPSGVIRCEVKLPRKLLDSYDIEFGDKYDEEGKTI